MGSKKRSSWSKQKAEFNASLGGGSFDDLFDDVGSACDGSRGIDDAFARESTRRRKRASEKEAAQRHRACESKNRYATRGEAEAAIASCADYGTTGLQSYKCPYCDGWHLTSHPWE